jgi:hypothetical protein
VRVNDRRRLALSTQGGSAPFWSVDGRFVLFTSAGMLMKVAVDPSGDRASTPVEIMRLEGATPSGVTADGRTLVRRNETIGSSRAVLTLEWIRELRQLLGPPTAALPR